MNEIQALSGRWHKFGVIQVVHLRFAFLWNNIESGVIIIVHSHIDSENKKFWQNMEVGLIQGGDTHQKEILETIEVLQ